MAIYNLHEEMIKMKRAGSANFWKISRYLRFSASIMTLLIIVEANLQKFGYLLIGKTATIYLAVVTIILIWSEFFYWARLSS